MSPLRHITAPELTEREELVLRYIVQNYILTASPVGSRYVSKRLEEESVSAATIRNVMADLEEKGFITHPHTSAGRVPTDLGYRLYVDALTRSEKLTRAERNAIEQNIGTDATPAILMRETSRLIGAISNQLGIVTAPEILTSVLQRIELVPLSSSRVLVVLSMQSKLVRTITLELHEEVSREQIGSLVQTMNERLAGLTLGAIRSTFHDRMKDVAAESGSGLVRFFFNAADKIFAANGDQRIHISPTQNILRQPEFSSPEQVMGVVELIENEEVIVHMLEARQRGEENTIEVTIGREHSDERLADFSLITTRYRIGDTAGTIGLIGPKRMNYSRMITVVEYVAKTITAHFEAG